MDIKGIRIETLQEGDRTEIETVFEINGEDMTTHDTVFHFTALLQAFENHFVDAGIAREIAKKATETAFAAYKGGIFQGEV